jgi:TolB-like protein/Tfp pilus assembly protein PilF
VKTSFFAELKRRNVYKVAVAYAVVSWLLIQVATQTFPVFGIPNWTVRLVVVCLILGLPIALVFAWVFELTPEGLKRTEEVPRHESITHSTGRKLDFAVIAVLAVVVTLLLVDRYRHASAPGSSALEKSIAVLPFENMSEEKENAFFADGVQDDILTALGKIADLKVISRTSVMSYTANAHRDLREIGKALGVAHVLEGSVRRAAGKVRVSAQLIDARTNTHLWAESYDRDVADVFAIQAEIAKAIADQLQARLSPHEKVAIEQRSTADVAAFDFYTRAKTIRLTSTFGPLFKERLLQAIELLNQAVARDPAFLLAWCELVTAHDVLYFAGYDHTAARLALADHAVETALRLRPEAGVAHLALAQHRYHGYRDYERARVELEIARGTLPNAAEVFALTGYIDRRQGRWADSTRNLERAIELDPRNAFTLGQISTNYAYLRRYAEAARVLDSALTIAPKDVLTRVRRGWVDFDWRADPRPLHAAITAIVSEDPTAAPTIAGDCLLLALCERDLIAAEGARAALNSDEALTLGHMFLNRAFGEGLVARVRGDAAAAAAAFQRALIQQEEVVRAQPEHAPAIAVLGLIEAALGRREDALRDGRRAMELLPLDRDSLTGGDAVVVYAIICAWTGESDQAFEQLATATSRPTLVTYGQLKLHPWWDPLRADPRFEAVLNSLAPK